jgi:hypothetical protein
VTTPTQSAFLAAYAKEMIEAYLGGTDASFRDELMAEYHKTLSIDKIATWLPGSNCAERAWHAIGMTGWPTIEALRRLEP